MYIYPVSRLQDLQTKEWIVNLTDNFMLGVKDERYLYKVRQTKIDGVSFYYNYFFFHTDKYTIYTLFNLNNKFSNNITLNVYLYNFESRHAEMSQIVLDFNDLKARKENDTLIVQLGDAYIQKINMIANTFEITVNSPTISYNFELYIDDYTTNQPTYVPRYNSIRSLVNPYNPITSTPGEWCSDNPMIGKIIKGQINDDMIQTGGNFWFDNYIGVNDHFLSSYIWNVVLNDDWLIYVLWFGEYEVENKTVCFIVKDRKLDKVIRAGFGRTVIPDSYKFLDSLNDPVKSDYRSNKKPGDLQYDGFNCYFETNEISVKFEAIKGESHRVFLYDYYKTDDLYATKNINTKFDEDYNNIIQNYRYVEYVSMVNVEIKYNNTIERFTDRCVIDSMFKKDKSMPNSI